MRTKQFKAESKRLLDMMINSIYTHKEIFLRELISNASDAMDKLYYQSLSGNAGGLTRSEFRIRLAVDKDARTLTVSDNGCGMTKEALEDNLGTIARSGSLEFKSTNDKVEDVDIIGQFGVGFYSAFMVSDRVIVESKAFDSDEAYRWSSSGADGYTVESCDKSDNGTVITLHIKESTEDENYDEFLEEYTLKRIVKKYSDYIRYPIVMDCETRRLKEGTEDEYETVLEEKTINSMVPLWKKNKSEIENEEYVSFYKDKFYDYEEPARIIHSKTEGQATYNALIFIPRHAPHDYYTREYEKGIQLYSSGVLIMDKCPDLIPDFLSFAKGLVDSEDLSLNISREMLQHDRQLRIIAKSLEKKIVGEMKKLMTDDRETYETFFKAFGMQLKYGVYDRYGADKETIKDLLMFCSSKEKKLVTLAEYVAGMQEGQDKIYYACGETADKIELLPQTELVRDKGYEILYLTESVDEFALKMLNEYDSKGFVNICGDELDLDSGEEKEQLEEKNEGAKDMLDYMRESVGGQVKSVRFTNKLKNHPVCLTSEGNLTVEMEKVLNSMPTDEKVQAQLVLEINAGHPIADKLTELFTSDREALAEYARILYSQARLIEGMTVDDPTELCSLVCKLMTK